MVKSNFQTVSRQVESDPVIRSPVRDGAGIAEQRLVLTVLERAAAAGELDAVFAAARCGKREKAQ